MPSLPSGTVTLVFTDIVGSTRLWEAHPTAMVQAIERHNAVALEVVGRWSGHVFKFVGDRVCAVFPRAEDAICGALELLRELSAITVGEFGELSIRIGIHTGTPETDGSDYFGPHVNRVSRICDLGHGGQVLVSAVSLMLAGEPKERWAAQDLGEAHLRGIARPELVAQVDPFGAPGKFPALREAAPGSSRRHNLPADTVQVVGREEETLHLESLFIKQGARLVTIIGMGGLGKTTLARHVARRLLPPFGNNVCYVDCEAVCELHELESAIRATLFAGEAESDRPSWEVIGDAKMLVVLDCLERAVQHASHVRHLLERCPNLQVLATSRVVLGLELEHEVLLQGLGLKSQGAEASPAEALFLQSAARTVGALGQRHRSKVRQLVQDLEAVPLGIVLAAGRLRHLSLDQVCEQVHANRIALLSAPSHARGKHASMEQVIAGSFDLLEARDFDLSLRASAFEGGFSLEDAIGCFGDPDTLDGISRLRDHSLLQASIREGVMRYRVPDSVREYLAMRAPVGRLEEARDAHMRFYAGRAAALRSLVGRAEWTEATRSMRLELGNFRAAVRWARSRPGAGKELNVLTGALARCFLEAGLNDDFCAVASGLSAEYVDADPELGMELLGLWGAYHRRRREPEEAKTFWLRRLEFGQRYQDDVIVSDTLLDLADLAVSEGDVEGAAGWHERFEAARGEATPAALRASGSLVGAKIALARGSRGEAQAQIEQAEVDACALSNTPLSLYVWRALSQLWRELGQFDRARHHASALLRAALESDHKHYAGRALVELAATALDAGEPCSAGEILAVAVLIPRNASPNLRNSVLEFKKRLPVEGRDAFERTKALAGTTNWENLALEWSTGVSSPS